MQHASPPGIPAAPPKVNFPDLSDIRNFLSVALVLLFSVIIVLSLLIGGFVPTASQTTTTVLAIASSVLSAIVGFHFGNRGVEQAEAQASSALNTAKSLEVSREAAQQEAREAREELQAGHAARLNGEALSLHYKGDLGGAAGKYAQALESVTSDELKAEIVTNYSYLLLDFEAPDYPKVQSYTEDALDILNRALERDPWWIGICKLALAVARGNLGDRDGAAELLNDIAPRFADYGYLFDEKNLEPRHFKALRRSDAPEAYRREVLDFLREKGIDLAK